MYSLFWNTDHSLNMRLPVNVANRFKQVETQSERKGEIVMAKNIRWETEIDAALARSRVEQKPVLLDFFNPG